MKCLYDSLDEATKRRCASVEVDKLGHGGKKYITGLFQCSGNTLNRGQIEMASGLKEIEVGRIWKRGSGAKLKKDDSFIQQVFIEVVGEHTSGNPGEQSIRWIYLHQDEIVEKMQEKGVNIK